MTTPKLAAKSVTSGKIAVGAVTSGKIKDGAVTLQKVTPKLSNSVGQFCLPGENVVGMDTDGNFSCEAPPILASVGQFCLPDETVVGMDTDGNFSCEVPPTLASDGSSNTRAGTGALSVNAGGFNTAVGSRALAGNTTGGANAAIGALTLSKNTTGINNVGVGRSALQNNTTGTNNTALGHIAMLNTTTGGFNTAIGRFALLNNTSGIQNIAIGHSAGENLTTGGSNIAIGNNGVAAESFTIRIGTFQDRTFIAGIRSVATGLNNATTVYIDGNGQLGTINSSRRYKEEIHDMEAASERLLSLRPVTFRYKKAFEGGDKPVQFGLIAEEVAEVFPELVVYNEDGAPQTVKYRLLSTLLLNELQKQEAELRNQRTDLQALTTRLVRLETAKAGAIANIQ